MRKVAVDVESAIPDEWQGLTQQEFDQVLRITEQIHHLQSIQARNTQRSILFWYLLCAGTVILGVSLWLVVGSAYGVVSLPASVTSTLVASVAAEFVGMLYLVVRYLFS